jgi:hypothetical protein
MGNCLPKKKKRHDIDAAITGLQEALAVRTAAHQLAKTSLKDVEQNIRDTLAHNGNDKNALVLLVAKRNMAQGQLDTATTHLVEANRRLAVAQEAKTHSIAQSITSKVLPHIAYSGAIADRELSTEEDTIENMMDYTTTLTSEATAGTSELMAKATEEAEKYMKQHEEQEQQQVNDLPEPPAGAYRPTTSINRRIVVADTNVCYSTV